MTDNPQADRGLRAVFTVTVESRRGPAYFDRDGFVLHAVSRIEGALEHSDDIRDVIVVEAEPAAVPSAPADRAATLREAADFYDRLLTDMGGAVECDPRYWQAIRRVATELRRMADEAQQPDPGTPLCGAWGGCPLPRGHNMGQADVPSNHQSKAEPAADPSWPRRAWDLGLLHKGDDPHHCPACLKQPEPPKNFICPGPEANAEVLANPQPVKEA